MKKASKLAFECDLAALRLQDPLQFDFRPATDSPLVDAGVLVPPYTDGFGAGLQQLNWEQTSGPTQGKRHELVLSRDAV